MSPDQPMHGDFDVQLSRTMSHYRSYSLLHAKPSMLSVWNLRIRIQERILERQRRINERLKCLLPVESRRECLLEIRYLLLEKWLLLPYRRLWPHSLLRPLLLWGDLLLARKWDLCTRLLERSGGGSESLLARIHIHHIKRAAVSSTRVVS